LELLLELAVRVTPANCIRRTAEPTIMPESGAPAQIGHARVVTHRDFGLHFVAMVVVDHLTEAPGA